MFKKLGTFVLILVALAAAACGAPAGTGIDNTNSAYPGAVVNGNDANTNGAGLDNDNNANGNSAGLGNTNDANTNSTGLGNTNDANSNSSGTANTNDANTNSANTNDANTNDGLSGNANDANTNGGTGATTPGAPAGAGLTTVQTYDQWAQAMQAQGDVITPQGEASTLGFDGLPAGLGRAVTLGEAQIQVIEFENEATRQQVSQALANGQAQLEALFPGMGQQATVWAGGRIIVIYFGNQASVISRVSQVMGSPLRGDSGGEAPAALMDSAQQWLAGQLAVDGSQIQLVSVQPRTFNDGCLELGNPGEFCTLAQVPGYAIVYSVNGQQYTAHVSQDGATMRLQQATP